MNPCALDDDESQNLSQSRSMEEIYQNVYEGVDPDELSFDEQEARNELVYVRTFRAIRDNDPTVTAFHPIDLQIRPARRCVLRLAAALAQNKNDHIQWIQLHLDGSVCYLRAQPRVASLVQYLRESTALRRVDIDLADDEGLEHFQSMIQALTDRFSLETLKLGIDEVLPLDDDAAPDVARLIETTTSLRELEMTWTDNDNIATAFVSNRTIKVLKLNFYGSVRGHLLSNYVAQSSLPSLLTELSVEFHRHRMNLPELDRALSVFLQSAAPSLQKLTVRSMAFNDESMNLFLDGILYHQTLHKLEFESCIFNDGPARSFIKFLQNDTTSMIIESGNNDANAPRQQPCNIKSLHILWGDVRVLAASDTPNMANLLALILQESRSLEHLHWAPPCNENYEPVQFWNSVSDNASKIRLSSLRLDCCDDEGYEALLRFLPTLHHLRVFECQSHEDVTNQIPEHLVLNMVRTNGSMFRFPDDNDNEKNQISIWDRHPAVKPRIRAYFQRNEGLSKLLVCPCIEAAADDDDGDRRAKGAKKENSVEDIIHLMPLLFAAAKPVTCLAPNYILAGLLKLVDQIGPNIQE